MTEEKKRAFVIGLDGATFEIIMPMVKSGKLPNFARLIKEGAYGPLKSAMPPITPCAWTSFGTGKDPSKHGLYDFNLHEGDPEKKKSANRSLVRAKSLWQLLTEAGKRSVVIDVPLTYPPEEIDGVLISRVMAPPKKNCTHPRPLYYTLRRKGFIEKAQKKKIADVHGAEKANKEEVKRNPKKISKAKMKKMARERIEKAFKHMKEEIDKNMRLATGFMEKENWDFFMIVFMSADHAGHTFWRDQVKVRKIYEKLDEAVGKLFTLAGAHTAKFIMSDHGFTTIPYSFNINEWLARKGLLKKKLDIPWKESMKELKEFLRKSKEKSQKGKKKKKQDKLTKFRFLIKTDYSRSKAYLQSGTSYGVRINLEGRDTTGIVKAADYECFRNRLISEFKEIKHPRAGKKVFSHVLKKEEVYSESPFGTDPSPDIFLLTPGMKIMIEGQFTQVAKMFGKTSRGYGFHHTDGIFFSRGKGIKNLPLESPKITDLTPTILHVLGVPIPDDLDGRVLREIFEPGSPYAEQETRYQGPSVIEREEKKAYSKREEEKVKKRLEALGYIE
ncbi:MAG: alkaline phosphatase family protein [Candidatus Omnitrophota bacterium]